MGSEDRVHHAQLSTYLTMVAMSNLPEGHSMVTCTACSFFKIAESPEEVAQQVIFCCDNDLCRVRHCLICKSTLRTLPTIEEDDSMEIDDDDIEEQMHHLTQCRSLWEEKMRFDTALDAGSTMPCPSCGVPGRKDGMCTHMSCAGCCTEWCYVCGLDVEKCDKAKGKTSIYDHNEGFQKNPKRCPMYLNQLQTVDEEWSVENLRGTLEENEDEEDEEIDEEEVEILCVNKFHRWKTLRLLKELKDDLGPEKWDALKATFHTVRECGFTDDEIDAANVPLFVRGQDSDEDGDQEMSGEDQDSDPDSQHASEDEDQDSDDE